MCGRFAASASTDDYVDVFGVVEVVDAPPLSFNIAPTDPVPAIVDRADADGAFTRKLIAPRWGLVPSWSKDASGAARMINARAETVAERPAFRAALASRRCLIPALGYYEWYQLSTGGKQPFFIAPHDGGLLAMAGLYEFFKRGEGDWLVTATIITTSARDEIGRLHDRMPMTVAPESWEEWLDPHHRDALSASALLAAPSGLSAIAVSTAVNSVRNRGPELIRPLPEPPQDLR